MTGQENGVDAPAGRPGLVGRFNSRELDQTRGEFLVEVSDGGGIERHGLALGPDVGRIARDGVVTVGVHEREFVQLHGEKSGRSMAVM